MSRLKEKSLNKSISLLREFIEESSMAETKKGVAGLALDHLKRITAGNDSGNGCHFRPRADGSPFDTSA
ncbi:MAG: hypothetical protein GY940_34065 [bacterium]|nr:hypothetical protein [bacterium]